VAARVEGERMLLSVTRMLKSVHEWLNVKGDAPESAIKIDRSEIVDTASR
jgi:hypothetical protein